MLTSPRHVRRVCVAALLCSGSLAWPASARAEEPIGCDGFKWPLAQQAAVMSRADKQPSAGALVRADATAYRLPLVEQTQAHLPKPPERPSKVTPSNAGFLRFEQPAFATLQITVSEAAWIDVIQDGRYVKPSAFTGARDCPSVRKSMRFQLAPMPFIVQVSATSAPAITLMAEALPENEGAGRSSK